MDIYFLNQIKETNFGPMEMLQPKSLINNNLTNGEIKFGQI